MNTYIQAHNGDIFAVRASRATVKNNFFIKNGPYKIIPATKKLKDSSRLNVFVKCLRILDDGRLGYL
jgi:hypothetical protein